MDVKLWLALTGKLSATVILNENTIADLSFEQIYCLDSHLTKSGSDSKELIVKLAPYQCKVYIFGKTD